ncbi:hypothetical protein [Mediterraneibacter gnavus]|uniref:hypothetical protein n=1 Tax=Mediterraneibacter gnavus TaxID=33038 RepID=UPI0015713EAF|nr:hypothetical protein [Mediterraneibacter gnavus]NSC48102.1 hypothetical protein [Mediterraneibacter gnavus]
MPPLLYFDGVFCHHFAILMALSATTFSHPKIYNFTTEFFGGVFCHHFPILVADFAITLLF